MLCKTLSHFLTAVVLIAASVRLAAADFQTTAANGPAINIATAHSVLMLRVGGDKRLYETHYGAPRKETAPTEMLPRETEFFPPSGDGLEIAFTLRMRRSPVRA